MIIRLNFLHPIYLAKALLPKLLSRTQRSAIVLTSSVTSQVATVAFAPYSSSKAGAATFVEALHFEVKDKIEIYSWDSGVVATKINPYKIGFRSNTQQAVNGCFKDIGC